MSGLRVTADRELCVGTGNCVFAAPEVFAQSEKDGRVMVFDATPGADSRESVEEAVDVCPVAAIALHLAAEEKPARHEGVSR